MVGLGWPILFAPAAACLGIAIFFQRSRRWAAGLGVGSLAVGFVTSLLLLVQLLASQVHTTVQISLPWVILSGLSWEFGILLDPLAILMSAVVTGVGLMIFIYSVGYMGQDPGFCRYFAFLSLFAFSMLGIVLANNFVTLFIFWELVGASSYLLIGFWYQRPQAAEAGKKAFLVNRIADFGFLVGILMLFSLSGIGAQEKTLNFLQLEERLSDLVSSGAARQGMWLAAALVFCGVVGKSAQFPLHVWLPDAMEGPTPVSALIHAATMVAAGVYLLARVFFLFLPLADLMTLIAIVGGFTALFAASLALVENDIKRVLAYSTLSQLGYMVMALGLGGLTPGIYHLTTHAFFKALLFMGAGCVIHALHTNDIRQMGGLLKWMPVTGATFLLAGLALCGIWPFSGFFSKDEILTLALERHRILGIVATATAGLTAFYMGRVFTVTFLGRSRVPMHSHEGPTQERLTQEASVRAAPPHEAPAVMTVPMLVLAFFSTVGGFLGIPTLLHEAPGVHVKFSLPVALLSHLVALAGLGLSYLIYGLNFRFGPQWKETFSQVYRILVRKFYIDEIYAWINQNIQGRIATVMSLFERYVIIGLWVNGTAKLTGLAGATVRLAQTGRVQAYALTLLAGLVILIAVTR